VPGYQLIKDPEYGFLRLDPIPPSADTGRQDRNVEEKTEFDPGRYEDLLAVATELLGNLSGRRLIDIHCGFGELLRYCAGRGLECVGHAVAPEAAAHLRALGFELSTAGLDTDFAELRGRKFDIVTLFNVLEHLQDPARILHSIREHLLQPEGLLVVDVPNEFNLFQKVAHEEHDLGEWWVAPPTHINYFGVSSLRALLGGCGYEVLDTLASFPMEIFLLMGDVYVGNAELGKLCHQKRVRFEQTMRRHGEAGGLRNFYRALAGCEVGRQVVCYARPDPFSRSTPPRQLPERRS